MKIRITKHASQIETLSSSIDKSILRDEEIGHANDEVNRIPTTGGRFVEGFLVTQRSVEHPMCA